MNNDLGPLSFLNNRFFGIDRTHNHRLSLVKFLIFKTFSYPFFLFPLNQRRGKRELDYGVEVMAGISVSTGVDDGFQMGAGVGITSTDCRIQPS